MTYLKDSYQKFLADPRSAPLAANVSLIYVTSTTKVDGADAVATHVSRQSSIVKKKSEQVISAIESSDSLCLDMETTLEFVDGGGAYLPSLDDNFLADRVVTFPTVHIVHFNAEHQIQQVRIYWDQGSLLKEVEVIGARGRTWPIREAAEQTRILRSAATAKAAAPSLAPSQGASGDLPHRPSSPGKRHIKDPYAADSLFDLLAPNKAEAAKPKEKEKEKEVPRPSSPGKRYTRDPYAAGSLTELLSPTKPETSAPARPYAPSTAQPAPRQYGDLFVGDDEVPGTSSREEKVIAPKGGANKSQDIRIFQDEEVPGTPSREEKVIAPKGGANKSQGSRIFQDEDASADDRAPYKADPRRFSHFEIGADNSGLEVKEELKRGNSRHQSQWDFSDFTTPQKSARTQPAEEARSFGYGDEGEQVATPPAKPAVSKPRRDADVHFEMVDKSPEGDDARVISSFQNRGQRLYENRLYDEEGEAMPSEEATRHDALSVVGPNANRKKDFDPHWEMTDSSPVPSKSDRENAHDMPSDRVKSVKQMESSWDSYDQSREHVRPANSLRNPARHNQPSWTYGDGA